MSKLTKAKLDKLKSENPNMYEVPLVGDIEIYVNPLGRTKNAEVQNIVQELQNKGAKEPEVQIKVENVVIEECVVHPSGKELEDLLESRAGIAPTLVEQIYAISGFLVMDTPKKL